MCSRLVYNESGPQTHAWHLSPQPFRRAAYPTHVFCWTLCANDSWPTQKFAWHSNATYHKHLLLEFSVGYVLMTINWCGRCVIIAPLPQIAKLPKIAQNHGFKICELTWVGVLTLFWTRVTFCPFGDDLSAGSIKKPSPISFLKCCPTRPLLKSLIWSPTKHNFNVRLWVVTSNLQTSRQLVLSKRL